MKRACVATDLREGKRVHTNAVVVNRLQDTIKGLRTKLVADSASQTQVLHAREVALITQIAACTGRHQRHERTQLQLQLEAVRREAADLTDCKEQQRLEQLVVGLNDTINRGAADMKAVADEFMAMVEHRNSHIRPITQDRCDKCNEVMLLTQEAQVVCPQCGKFEAYLDATSFSMAYGEEVEFTTYTYKRETHFKERMNKCQAKQGTDVPLATLRVILSKLQEKYAVRGPADIELHMIRPALKELQKQGPGGVHTNYHKLYDHRMLIYTRLSGKPPPRLTPEQENNILMLFRAIQAPFEVHRPPDRKNFLSYDYCLFKFCQLLGYHDFLKYFRLLKGGQKLKNQDDIMKAIFKDLGWEWIPTNRVYTK